MHTGRLTVTPRDRRGDRRTYIHTYIHKHRDINTDRHTLRYTYIQRGIHSETHEYIQIHIPNDRDTMIDINRQIDIHIHIHIKPIIIV